MKSQQSAHRGYTLFELLVVAAILGLLFLIAFPVFRNARRAAKAVHCLGTRRSVETTETLYMARHESNPSPTFDALWEFLGVTPRCMEEGVYLWITREPLPLLGCSIHYWSTPAPSGSQVLFTTSFASMDGLDVLKGKWVANKKGLRPVGGRGEHTLAFGDEEWADYEVNVTATLLKGPGYGIYYRSDGEADITGYILQYEPGWDSYFVVRKVYNGQHGSSFQSARMPAGFPIYGQSHQISIAVQGDHHVIKIDGEPILDFHDDAFRSGKVGFRTWGNTKCRFTRATVTAIPE